MGSCWAVLGVCLSSVVSRSSTWRISLLALAIAAGELLGLLITLRSAFLASVSSCCSSCCCVFVCC